MALNIVSGTEVQTQATGVKIDPSAFRRQAIAQGQLVSGAGQDVASLFTEIGNKMQDITNTKHIVDADNAVITFNQKQQEEVLKHPNPKEWSSIYNANFKQFQDGVMSNPEYGPDVRNRIRNMLEGSKTATDINIRTAANKRYVTDTTNSIDYGMNVAVNSLPKEAAKEKYYSSLDLKKEKGLINDDQYKLGLEQAPRIIDKGQLDQALAGNPIEGYAYILAKDKDGKPLNATSIVGKERDAITNTFRIRAVRQQSDNFNVMLQDNYDPSINGVPENVVVEKMNTYQISYKAGENYINAQKKAADAVTKKQVEDVAKENTQQLQHVMALAANPLDWKSRKPDDNRDFLLQEAASITDKVKQEKAITYIQRQYQSVLKQGRTEEKPWQADILSRITEDREKNALTVPLIPEIPEGSDEPTGKYVAIMGGLNSLRKMSDEDIKKNFGTKAKRADVLQAEQVYFDKIRDDMREWFNDPNNENKTRQDAEEYRKQLEAPAVYNVAKKSLVPQSKFTVGKIYTDAKGNKARWDGEAFVTP